jgi:DedD protein
MPDEGLQEIQLRGKQLVFLAMSATVVAVVIFLCGVMVGRGVPTARQAITGPIEPDPLTLTPDPEAGAKTAEALDPAASAPPAPLEYPDLVNDTTRAAKPLKPSPEVPPFAAENAVDGPKTSRRATPASATAKAPAAPVKASAAATKATESPAATTATAGSGGFQVQVAAYQREGDASALRDRLAKKGYRASVSSASTAAGTFFRVRVGGYETRNEAQAVAGRLKREEQLEPWVTR